MNKSAEHAAYNQLQNPRDPRIVLNIQSTMETFSTRKDAQITNQRTKDNHLRTSRKSICSEGKVS